jgi:putative phosphoesterase
MKIGLVSDTHKHIANLNEAVAFLKTQGADIIVHLGDDYMDVDEIGENNVLRVPGVFSDAYQDTSIPNRMIAKFDGWRILLSHTISSHNNDLPDDVKPEEMIAKRKIDAVFYGHTHIPEVTHEHGIVYVNPGHLKDEDKKGSPPTCAFIDVKKDVMRVCIFDLKTKDVYKEETFTRGTT